MSILKVDYFDELRFKSLKEGDFTTTVDFTVDISKEKSLNLLDRIRDVIRDESFMVDKFGNKGLNISYNMGTLLIYVDEVRGEQSRPLGKFCYTDYMHGMSILEGLRVDARKIEEQEY